MNNTILNDTVVAEKIKAYEAEFEVLQKKATNEDAEKILANCDVYDISKVLPKGTVAGEIRRAKKQGVEQAYGFVSTNVGDIFVPPPMMAAFQTGAKVAVLVADGPRGKAADRIANLDDYISWHKEEVLKNICEEIDAERARKLRWYGSMDPSDGWDEMKAKCSALGLELREIRKELKSSNYGGRGSDHYRFSSAVTEEQAAAVLDALGARHAEPNPKGPYDPGHDHIVLTVNGFRNDWCGPFTD